MTGEARCGYPYMVATFWVWGCRSRYVGGETCTEETHREGDGRWGWTMYEEEDDPDYSHEMDDDEQASWCSAPSPGGIR